ncbi:MAG: GNAT family N-acetyltransferase [Saprospiraceae bacterium]
MKIITAELSHLDLLSPLFDAYRVFYRQTSDLAAARNFLAARLQQKESVIFLAFEGKIPCGFTQLYPIFTSVGMRKSWLLNDLYVAASFRQRGIAQGLIEHAKDWSRETQAAGLLLETEKENVAGNQLYPKMGFELYDATNFYFWKNEAL